MWHCAHTDWHWQGVTLTVTLTHITVRLTLCRGRIGCRRFPDLGKPAYHKLTMTSSPIVDLVLSY